MKTPKNTSSYVLYLVRYHKIIIEKKIIANKSFPKIKYKCVAFSQFLHGLGKQLKNLKIDHNILPTKLYSLQKSYPPSLVVVIDSLFLPKKVIIYQYNIKINKSLLYHCKTYTFFASFEIKYKYLHK